MKHNPGEMPVPPLKMTAAVVGLTIQLLGVLATLVVALNWRSIWGDFDLWIPPAMSIVQLALFVGSLIAVWRLAGVRRRVGAMPALVGFAAGVVANVVFFAIAWNDLPLTAFAY